MSRYVDLFVAESRDHLGAAYAIQSRLDDATDAESWSELLRHAHSLKGMAATMGYRSIVSLAHALEDMLQQLRVVSHGVVVEHLPILGESLECLGRVIDRVEQGLPAEDPAAEGLARSLRDLAVSDADVSPTPLGPELSPAVVDVPDPEIPEESADESVWSVSLHFDPKRAVSAEWTVSTLGQLAVLGRVVQANPPLLALDSGEFEGRLRLVLASRIPGRSLELRLRALDGVLGVEIVPAPAVPRLPVAPPEGPSWVRVRADLLDLLAEQLLQLRLEHGRMKLGMTEATGETQQGLQRAEVELDAAYGTLMELRLIAFETIAQRLQHSARELSRSLDKDARLEIVGGSVRLDRSILDGLVDPLTHILRNALDHGIEPAAERRTAGKNARALVRLGVERSGDRVNIVVEDDGRGMLPDVLREHAVSRGILDRAAAAALNDSEALSLATLPGLSTATAVTEVSGRGVGLDVVRDRIESLGGILEIESTPGKGTAVRIAVPLRLALVRTMLVRIGGQLFGVPVDTVQRTSRLSDAFSPDAPTRFRNLVRLDRRLGCDDGAEPDRPWVLCVESESQSVGLVVDEVVGRRDVVVKPFRSPLAHMREYTGAAILEDGGIALVLDALYLAESGSPASAEV